MASATLLIAGSAHADVSSWFSAGAGYGLKRSESRDFYDRATALSFAVGVGTDPTASVVGGGVIRGSTYFTLGTDVSVAARVASGGFARGQWGLAVDVGPMLRLWGARDYGRFPLACMVIAGAPFGFQLAVGAELWSLSGEPYARGGVALLELDLLRLTVMRQGATDRFWENPSPAGGRMRP